MNSSLKYLEFKSLKIYFFEGDGAVNIGATGIKRSFQMVEIRKEDKNKLNNIGILF